MGEKLEGGARAAALRVLMRVSSGAYADIVLEKELGRIAEVDRPLVTEIVYGVLRRLITLDWVIGQVSSIRPARIETKVLNALRIGAYQLLFLSRVPPSAAINETVNLVKPGGPKKAGFVNAVLRKIDSGRTSISYPDIGEDPVLHVSTVHSHPEWLVRRWIPRYGIEETVSLCNADNSVPPKTLRVNTTLISREALIEEAGKTGLRLEKCAFSPDGCVALEGKTDPLDPRYYIQDEASQLIAHLVAPREGEIVLDACAAPGGKTTHMAQLMRNTGAIYALDKQRGRLKTLEESIKRFSLTDIRTAEADASDPEALEKSLKETFDAVLVDAPCSGLGVLRRSPDIKMRRKEEDITGLSKLQGRILGNVSRYLKKGGRLVYSVCSFEPEETDLVIKNFLDSHRDFIMEDASLFLPPSCKPLVDKKGLLRTFPHKHSLDGFFGARLKRH